MEQTRLPNDQQSHLQNQFNQMNLSNNVLQQQQAMRPNMPPPQGFRPQPNMPNPLGRPPMPQNMPPNQPFPQNVAPKPFPSSQSMNSISAAFRPETGQSGPSAIRPNMQPQPPNFRPPIMNQSPSQPMNSGSPQALRPPPPQMTSSHSQPNIAQMMPRPPFQNLPPGSRPPQPGNTEWNGPPTVHSLPPPPSMRPMGQRPPQQFTPGPPPPMMNGMNSPSPGTPPQHRPVVPSGPPIGMNRPPQPQGQPLQRPPPPFPQPAPISPMGNDSAMFVRPPIDNRVDNRQMFSSPGHSNSNVDTSSKAKIDPSQIPSAVQVLEQDLSVYENTPYLSSSSLVPPIISSRANVIDDGVASPLFVRSTMYNIPTTYDALSSCGIPLALIVQPFAKTPYPVPVVDVREAGPIRCNRCQGYINSLCKFIEGGKAFVCNICLAKNEVPESYFYNLDFNGKRADIDSRPELKYGSVDFVVAKEYILHPLNRPSILFAIDCSTAAQRSGAFTNSIDAIKQCLNNPSFSEMYSKMGVLTFDKTIQFYDLRETLNVPHVIVVADMEDPFVPLEKGFFCDVNKSRNLILALLDQLPSLFATNSIAGSVLGSVVKVATTALKEFGGGRLIVFQSILPDCGEAVLTNRENPAYTGTDKEVSLFNSNGDFYKSMAEECCINGVCTSIFAMSNGYLDAATIGFLSTWTGGDYYYYPHFTAEKYGYQLVKDLSNSIAKPFVFDVLGRVRVSNSMKVSQYFGNLGMRNALDMEFGALDSSHAIAISFEHDGKLEEKEIVSFQIALLHTTPQGERRVRVHNFSLVASALMSNVYRHASLESTMTYLSKHAVSQALVTPIKDIKTALIKRATKILSTYRKSCASTVAPGQLILPDPFKLLPLFILSMLKSRTFQNSVPVDERMTLFHFLRTMSVEETRVWYYPNLFSLHGLLDEPDNVQKAPTPLRLLYSSLEPQGIYLLENGVHAFIWIGKGVLTQYLIDLFNSNDLASINCLMPELPILNTKLSVKTRNLLQYLRSQRDDYVTIKIIRQGIDPAEVEFSGMFVEEQNNSYPSHVDFLCQLHSEIQQAEKK